MGAPLAPVDTWPAECAAAPARGGKVDAEPGEEGLAQFRHHAAIIGKIDMVAIAQRDPAYAIQRVEWSLLLLFASLFVVMRGFERTGAVAWLDAHALALVGAGSVWRAAAVVSGAMTTLSNLISNVPAVIVWRNTVPSLPDPQLMWRVVAMSSTFAGNLLLIGSIANLIVAERAEQRGVRIGFGEYARIGVPVTVLTVAWGVATLVILR